MNKKRHSSESMIKFLSSGWGLTLTACGLIGAGFGAGCYFEKSLSEIHHNDEVMKLNNEMLQNKEQYDSELHSLRNEIYSLQTELLKIKKDEKASK